MNRHEFYDKLKEYNSLQHYGTLGQKWGVRKWQNYDGTFNEAGKERYFGSNSKKSKTKINPKYQYDDGAIKTEYYSKINKLLEKGKTDEIEKLQNEINWDKAKEYSKNPQIHSNYDETKIYNTKEDPELLELMNMEKEYEDNRIKEILISQFGETETNNATKEDLEYYKDKYKNYMKLNENEIVDIYEEKVKMDREYEKEHSFYELLENENELDEELMKKYNLNDREWYQLKHDARRIIDDKKMQKRGYTKRHLTEEEIDKLAKERAESSMREEFGEGNVDQYNTDEEYEKAYQEYKKYYEKEFYDGARQGIERNPYEWVKEEDKIGSLFNPKSDFRDNPFYKEEQTILSKARFINDENIYLKKKALSQMAGEQIKFADQDPLLSNYYNDIEVLEAMKMQDKYPGIDINTIRQNHFHEENEPFIEVRYLDDNMKNALKRWEYLENKRFDYPVNSKKNNKCVGEMQKIDAEFLLKEKEIEEELANNVLNYVKNNKEKIQENVKNIRKNVNSINNIEIKVNEDGKERKYSLKDSPYVYDLWGYINRAINQLYLIHDYDKYENNSYQKGFSDLTNSDWKRIYNYVEKHFGEDVKNGMYKYWYNN